MGETREFWPAGASFLFDIDIANEAAAGASDIELIYTAGEGTEFEVLYGSVQNLDTVARNIQVTIDTGTSDLIPAMLKVSASTGAGGFGLFPENTTGQHSAGIRYLVSGPMRLRMRVITVADSENARFFGVLRLKGQAPTRTTVGAGTEVVTANLERVV